MPGTDMLCHPGCYGRAARCAVLSVWCGGSGGEVTCRPVSAERDAARGRKALRLPYDLYATCIAYCPTTVLRSAVDCIPIVPMQCPQLPSYITRRPTPALYNARYLRSA
eukprot:3500549-Rhodomonas_salina.2